MVYSGIFSSANPHPIKSYHTEQVISTGLSRAFSEIVRLNFIQAKHFNPYSIKSIELLGRETVNFNYNIRPYGFYSLEKLGIQTGDRIIAVDGNPLKSFRGIFLEIVNGNTITIERDGALQEVEIPVDFIETLLDNPDRMRFLAMRQPFVVSGHDPDHIVNPGVDFQAMDQVLSINGETAFYLDQAKDILARNKGQEVSLLVERANGSQTILMAQVNDSATLGVSLQSLTMQQFVDKGLMEIETKSYSLIESIPVGIERGVTTLGSYVKQLKKIFNPETGAYKGVGGFAAIGGLFPDVWDWQAFWGTTALLSVILAFMNILPIPALDGGHVLFLLYEMISGRKPSDKFLEYAQMVGFFILMGLLLFANGNDLYKLIFK